MLRRFIVWLMKVLLDVAIVLSLCAVAVAIAVTALFPADRNIGGLLLVGEIVLGAFALVGLFGMLSLLIEINDNLIRLRQAAPTARRVEPAL
jgi:hypothetical protein